eukprot:8739217-Karenia_brevis.AAC.1
MDEGTKCDQSQCGGHAISFSLQKGFRDNDDDPEAKEIIEKKIEKWKEVPKFPFSNGEDVSKPRWSDSGSEEELEEELEEEEREQDGKEQEERSEASIRPSLISSDEDGEGGESDEDDSLAAAIKAL